MVKQVKSRGFSLIELMIVVAVIGIIAAIAYPSYTRHVEKTRRTAAQADLMELAQFMERQYTNGYTYRPGDADPTLPFTTQPRSGTPAFYNYSLQTITNDTFVLQATPAGSQAGDDCGWLRVDQAGTRTNQTSDADCWR